MDPPARPADSTDALELQLAQAEAALTKISTRNLVSRFGIGAIFVVAGLAYALLGSFLPSILQISPRTLGFVSVVFGLSYIVAKEVTYQAILGRSKADLEFLKDRKRILTRLSGPSQTDGESSYFDSLVSINVENLAAYYTLVKVHTNKSFNVAVGVGIVGFLFIVVGLAVGFSDAKNATLTYISSGAGVITEFISGVFFYLYNRTVRQMKGYHDSLLSVQNVLLSFKLVGDTKDEKEKAKMVAQMLGYLIGKQPSHAPGEDDPAERPDQAIAAHG